MMTGSKRYSILRNFSCGAESHSIHSYVGLEVTPKVAGGALLPHIDIKYIQLRVFFSFPRHSPFLTSCPFALHLSPVLSLQETTSSS